MKVDLKIEGMSCQHCVMAVKKEIDKLNIIASDVRIGEASVEFDEQKTSRNQLMEAIKKAGYSVIN